MEHPQVVDGENGLQMWREVADILNKQSRTAGKGSFSGFGFERGADNSSPQKDSMLRNVTQEAEKFLTR
jgi:hypothetical protein